MAYLITTPDGIVKTVRPRSELRRIVPDPAEALKAALSSATCWVCKGSGEVKSPKLTEKALPCPRCKNDEFHKVAQAYQAEKKAQEEGPVSC